MSLSLKTIPLLDCFLGAGWHLPEVDSRFGMFRWTGPEPVSELKLPIAFDGPWVVKLHIIDELTPVSIENLRILLNSEPLEISVERSTSGPTVVTGLGSSYLQLSSSMSISIVLEGTNRPRNVKRGSDCRLLGVAINRIEIDQFESGTNQPTGTIPIDRPELSLDVVLPTTSPWSEISANILNTLAVTERASTRMIVVSGETCPTWPPDVCERVIWISLPGKTVFELRAAGYGKASADIVAITEDHCVPADNWISETKKTFAAHPNCIAAGGPVTNGSKENLIDCANFATTFFRLFHSGPNSKIPSVANMAFRRECLPPLPSGWLELNIFEAAAKIPGLLQSSSAEVAHIQSHGFWSTFSNHFYNGRASASFLTRHPAQGRLFAAIFHSLNGAIRNTWVALKVLRQQELNWDRRIALALLIAGLNICHSVGFTMGLAYGADQSAHKLS